MADPTPSGQTPATPDPAAPPVAADPAAPPVDPKLAADPAAPPAEPPKPAAPVAPEKYDFAALKLPEGVALDQPLLDAVSPVFKELGISQEGASKLVEAHVKHLVAAEAQRETDFKAWMGKQVSDHQAALRKEFGTAYDANMATAQKGIARVCTPAMKALLDETGLGNHPEFVKAFLAVGKMVSEDTPPNGQKPATRKSDAEVFYGTPN